MNSLNTYQFLSLPSILTMATSEDAVIEPVTDQVPPTQSEWELDEGTRQGLRDLVREIMGEVRGANEVSTRNAASK